MVNVGKYTIHGSVMENFVLPIDFLCQVVLEVTRFQALHVRLPLPRLLSLVKTLDSNHFKLTRCDACVA